MIGGPVQAGRHSIRTNTRGMGVWGIEIGAKTWEAYRVSDAQESPCLQYLEHLGISVAFSPIRPVVLNRA